MFSKSNQQTIIQHKSRRKTHTTSTFFTSIHSTFQIQGPTIQYRQHRWTTHLAVNKYTIHRKILNTKTTLRSNRQTETLLMIPTTSTRSWSSPQKTVCYQSWSPMLLLPSNSNHQQLRWKTNSVCSIQAKRWNLLSRMIPSTAKLKPYNSSPIPVLGTARCAVTFSSTSIPIEWHIITGSCEPILRWNWGSSSSTATPICFILYWWSTARR